MQFGLVEKIFSIFNKYLVINNLNLIWTNLYIEKNWNVEKSIISIDKRVFYYLI